MNSLLASLNPAQRAAAEHIAGPMLILAGPGSGKTRVVTYRIAHLLASGIPARQIVALTFTNKAAEEMRSRVAQLAPDQPVWLGTFHRFCARLLRQYASYAGLQENYSILDVDDSRRLLGAAVEEVRLPDGMVTVDQLAQAISWAKNQLMTPEAYPQVGGGLWKPLVERVYPAYQRRLLTANAVDFDDLLMHTAVMLQQQPELRRQLDARFRYIMVDEYQDTNLAQYAIVRALSVDHPHLVVVGDPDQSIYGWRGANVSNILEFEHDYPQVKVVKLEQNYRSTPNILAVADGLIRHNTARKDKRLKAERPPGTPVRLVCCPTHQDEAEMIAQRIAVDVRAGRRRPRDFAVFYRTNALSRQLEHAFHQQGVPYQIVHGVEFYQRREIKDLIAYLHLINNPANDAALLRVINTPARGIGKSTVERLREYGTAQNVPLLEAARRAGLIAGLNARATVSVARFVSLFDQLREYATAPVEELLGRVLSVTGYRAAFEGSQDPEDDDRLANIDELVTAAREYDIENAGPAPLEGFLEQAALVADTDGWEGSADKVTLMTLHAAKGLEFPVVFLIALEQGLLPHERSREDASQLEEERRLLFVGITRARDELQLSYAQYRMLRGTVRPTVPSSFLLELPREEIESSEPPSLTDWEGASARRGEPRDWDDDAEYFRDADEVDEQDTPQRLSRRRSLRRDPAPDSTIDSRRSSRSERPPAPAPLMTPESLAAVPAAADSPSPAGLPAGVTGKLTTAAALLGQPSTGKRRVSPDAFALGMLVRHPEYGTGKIVALSREGLRRQASVVFLTDGQERRFVLLHAHLEPIESDA
ncbi:MAG: UvrD-helicase domain-containing protein [Pirellulales bacterium]